MVASFHETQSKRKNERGLREHLWALQRALEGRSGRTERSKGAHRRIMHQRPENRGALNKPIPEPHIDEARAIRCRWLMYCSSPVEGGIQGSDLNSQPCQQRLCRRGSHAKREGGNKRDDGRQTMKL